MKTRKQLTRHAQMKKMGQLEPNKYNIDLENVIRHFGKVVEASKSFTRRNGGMV